MVCRVNGVKAQILLAGFIVALLQAVLHVSSDSSGLVRKALALLASGSPALAWDIPEPGGGSISYPSGGADDDSAGNWDGASGGRGDSADSPLDGSSASSQGASLASDSYPDPEFRPGAGPDGEVSYSGAAERAPEGSAEAAAVSFEFDSAHLSDPDNPHLLMKAPMGRPMSLGFGNAFKGIGVQGYIAAYQTLPDNQCDILYLNDGFGHGIALRLPWALYTPKDGWVKTEEGDPSMTHEGEDASGGGDGDGDVGSSEGDAGDDSESSVSESSGSGSGSIADSADPDFDPAAAEAVKSGGFSMEFVKKWSVILGGVSVTSILVLDDGPVWVGTAGDGLYLGTINGGWRVFTSAATGGALPSDHVTALAAYKFDGETRSSVYVGTNAGLCVYDGFTFKSHEAGAGGLAGNTVTALAVCPATGILYIGTQEGISIYKSGSFVTVTLDDGLPSNLVNALCGVDDKVWAGTTKGAAILTGYEPQPFGTSEGLPSQWVSCVATHPGPKQDSAGPDVFVGTPAGVTMVRAGGGISNYGLSTGMSHPWVKACAAETDELGRRHLWCGTDEGLLEYDGTRWTTWLPGSMPLPSKAITALVSSGTSLFVGTSKGLCVRTERVKRTTFGTGVEVQLLVDPVWNPVKRRYESLIHRPLPRINDMEMVGDQFWVATDRGLADLSSMIFYDQTNSGLMDPETYNICGDPSGNLWVASKGNGVVRFDGSSWTSYVPGNSRVPSTNSTAVAYDSSSGFVMAACGSFSGAVADKLLQFDGLRWDYFDKSRYLSPEVRARITDARFASCDSVTEIVPTDDCIWVCTDSVGAFQIDRGTGVWTQHRDSRNGLGSNKVVQAVADKYKNVWFASPEGLTMHYSGKWTHYDRYSGPGLFGYPNLRSVAVIDTSGLEVFCAGRDLTGDLSAGGVMRYDGRTWGTQGFGHVRRLMADGPFIWYGRDNGTVVKYKKNIMRPGKKKLAESPYLNKRAGGKAGSGGDGSKSTGETGGGGVDQECGPSG